MIEAHILCRSSSHVAFSCCRGVLVISLKTNSRTVLRLFGAGVKSFRLTCNADKSKLPTAATCGCNECVIIYAVSDALLLLLNGCAGHLVSRQWQQMLCDERTIGNIPERLSSGEVCQNLLHAQCLWPTCSQAGCQQQPKQIESFGAQKMYHPPLSPDRHCLLSP